MIDSFTLRELLKRCPNYHIVSPACAKKGDVVTCAKCAFDVPHKGGRHNCGSVVAANVPIGYAEVHTRGTCDNAKLANIPFSSTPLAQAAKDTPAEATTTEKEPDNATQY